MTARNLSRPGNIFNAAIDFAAWDGFNQGHASRDAEVEALKADNERLRKVVEIYQAQDRARDIRDGVVLDSKSKT